MGQKSLYLTTSKMSFLLSVIAAGCLCSLAIGWALAGSGTGFFMLLFTVEVAGTGLWLIINEMMGGHKNSFHTVLIANSVQIVLLIAGIFILESCGVGNLFDTSLFLILTGILIGGVCFTITNLCCQKWYRDQQQTTANQQPTPVA